MRPSDRTCAFDGRQPAQAYRLARGYRRPGETTSRKREVGAIDLCDACLRQYARLIEREEPT